MADQRRETLFSGPLRFARPPYIPASDPDRLGLPPSAIPRTYTVRLRRRAHWQVFRRSWRMVRTYVGRCESLRFALATTFGWSWLLRRPKRVRDQLRRAGGASRG